MHARPAPAGLEARYEPVRRAAAAGCTLPRMEMLYYLLRALAAKPAAC